MKRRLFVLLSLIAFAAGCRTRELPHIRVSDFQDRHHSGNPVIKVACVGDSITYGAGVEGRETNSYPAQLGEYLGSGFQVRNSSLATTTLMSLPATNWLSQVCANLSGSPLNRVTVNFAPST